MVLQKLAARMDGPLLDTARAMMTTRPLPVGYEVESLVGHLHEIRGAGTHTLARQDLPGYGCRPQPGCPAGRQRPPTPRFCGPERP